jgi:hypothetical protein
LRPYPPHTPEPVATTLKLTPVELAVPAGVVGVMVAQAVRAASEPTPPVGSAVKGVPPVAVEVTVTVCARPGVPPAMHWMVTG